MKTSNKTEELVTLATPYYGSIVRPHGRPEQIYIKLVANQTTGEFKHAGLCVWDSKKRPDLPSWLSEQGVSTLLCNDCHLRTEQNFTAAGISVFRKQLEDLHELISDWTTQRTTNCGDIAA